MYYVFNSVCLPKERANDTIYEFHSDFRHTSKDRIECLLLLLMRCLLRQYNIMITRIIRNKNT